MRVHGVSGGPASPAKERVPVMRQVLSAIARQSWVRKAAMSTPGVRGLAWRFVAGEDLPAGIEAARALNGRGVRATLNFVGTHVHGEAEAAAAARAVVECLGAIEAANVDGNVSIKLTKLGLDLDEGLCRAHLRDILEAARRTRNFVRIDMEESRYVDATLRLFDEAYREWGDGVGIVLQSYLRRNADDLERLLSAGAPIRIVKGGYWQAGDAVWRGKAEIDAAFARDVEALVRRGKRPAIATHDRAAIALAQRVAASIGRGKDDFEFQMLYGVRDDLQRELVRDGYRVRSYVPYGDRWYEYVLGCVRRLPGGAMARLSERAHRKH